jgi:hypothetical protein
VIHTDALTDGDPMEPLGEKKQVVAGYKSVCVDMHIYKFEYSKKCSGA